jgi:hypothetical protein
VDLDGLRKDLSLVRRRSYARVRTGDHLSIAVPLNERGEAALAFTAVPLDAEVRVVTQRLKALAADIAGGMDKQS